MNESAVHFDSNPSSSGIAVLLRGLAGAIVGGAIGFFVFRLLVRQGLYGMMIPGALLGLGAGVAARGKSIPLGIACALTAIALAICAEWSVFPFKNDPSLEFFVWNV